MKRHVPHLALALGLLIAASAAAQDVSGDATRFDVQGFRPTSAPQDLVLVGQSRPQAHLSASVGLVFNYALDPLVLVRQDSQQKFLGVVSNRVQLDAVAAISLFDWVELALDMPLILLQTSDNLEPLGTEGPIQSFAPGDLRTTAKVAIPGLRRPAEGKGFGAAATFGLSFPTGVQEAFASDGELTMSPGVILDYRFGSGVLLAVNGGYWGRPVGEFSGLRLGPMATFGAAAEVPVVRRWGITAVGAIYGAASILDGLDRLDQKRSVPAEFILGLRWYSSTGFTFTFGGGGGCGCSFSAPSFRLFASLIWVPGKTREYEALERFKVPPPPPPPPVDPDEDGVIGERDVCPETHGPVENRGCPDEDGDADGVVDRLDKCPAIAMPAGRGRDGCPLARIEGDRIVILDQVHFATDQDVILPESFPILEEVGRILKENPRIERLRIEGHTDSRASREHNLDLSRRRAASVERFLLEQGIEGKRMRSAGFGFHRRLLADNDRNEQAMALNRRVEFIIERVAPKPAQPQVVPASGQEKPSAVKDIENAVQKSSTPSTPAEGAKTQQPAPPAEGNAAPAETTVPASKPSKKSRLTPRPLIP